MALADGEIFAGYTIAGVLGAGGMGEVYLAQHPRLPRRDALKVLGTQVSHDPEYRQRFNQEAEMVATLRHPHIVTIYDRGEYDEKLWIAMEFVDGIDAGRLLSDHHPTGIPAAEVVRIVTAIADALDYAHSRRLLHRDIKPANILLGPPGNSDGPIMLADFGVARWLGQTSELTGTEMTVGTVTYAAPEQLKGEQIDGHADQYALAATAYHLLTGTAPFTNSNPAVVISQHLSAPPPAIANGHPDLAGFGPVFARALAKDPAKRYRNCRDFAAALQQALTQGSGTSPARHRKASTKSMRRRAMAVALGALVLLAAAVVVIDVVAHQRHTDVPEPAGPPPPAVSARMDLPVVVLGADCAVLGSAAVDATGADAYCARANSQTDQTVWSSIPERLRTGPSVDSISPTCHDSRRGAAMASNTAADIVATLGGAANIENLSHCATRLRFTLHDSAGIDQSDLESIPGVMGAVPQAGNRYQVVIGGGVQTVYNEIKALPGMGGGSGDDAAAVKAAARAKGPRGKIAWLDSFFEFLSDSFRPILGALLGASLFITFMALMSTLDVIPNWADPREASQLSPSWQFINLCWQSVFVFLPLMVAYNAAKKLGADPWVGFAIMAVVMLPGFTALKDFTDSKTVFGSQVDVVQVLGMPLTIFNYSSQVFPPLLMAAVLGPLYKFLKRVIPENVQLIFVPFLSMLIMIPLTAFLIGPIGVYTGAALGGFLKSVNDFSPLIFAILIPLAYPFMVPLGLHWPINAIMLVNIQTLGYDFIQGPMGAWNFACFGATAGVLFLAWRERDKQMRQTAMGGLAAGLLGGISEPSLYGIHLRFKRIYPRMLVGCLVGGLIIGLGGGVTTKAFVFTSLLTIPAFSNMGLYAVAVLAAFLTSMILVIISGYRTPEQAAAAAAAGVPVADLEGPMGQASPDTLVAAAATKALGDAGIVATVTAPLAGTVIPLAEVPDPVFSKGIMGPGVGIIPTGDTVYAPADGIIAAAQPTGHAFGMVLENGVELLVHVGIDTVKLKGDGFDVHVTKGQKVTAGTPLVTFDRTVIDNAGYSLVTPVIVMNGKKFGSVTPTVEGEVAVGDPLLDLAPAPAPAEAGL